MRFDFTNITYGILGSLMLLGLIIMYGVARASVFNLLYFSIGFGITGIPMLIILLINRSLEDSIQRNITHKKQHLKKTGDQIHVDLTKVNIKSNSWTSTEERYTDRVAMWNAIGGDSELNIKETKNNVSRLTFETDYKGQTRKFKGGTFSKDRHTLQMLLEHKGDTKIYVDPIDPSNYFFDLDFLKH